MYRFVPILFSALAALFIVLAILDRRKHGSKMTPARRAWTRIGVIFAAVSIYLYVAQRWFR